MRTQNALLTVFTKVPKTLYFIVKTMLNLIGFMAGLIIFINRGKVIHKSEGFTVLQRPSRLYEQWY
jgi:hypothetical protein